MKTIKTAFICTLLSGVVNGQQDIQFTQTLSNPYLFNVGAAGMTNVTEFNFGTRSQWLSVEGKPVTYYASGHTRIGKKSESVLDEFNTDKKLVYASPNRTIGNKHIFGGKVISDIVGPFARTTGMLSYAFHLPLTQKVNVGLGIGLGLSNFSIDNSKVKLFDADDDAYKSYLGASSRQTFADVQSGVVIYSNRLFIGISGTQLMRNNTQFKALETESHFERHWYFMGSYRFDLGAKFGLEPVAMVKTVTGSPASYDAGARLHYQRMGWVSFGYRGKSAFSIGFGLNVLKQFSIAYAYEAAVSNLRSYGNGSHEVHLGLLLGRKRDIEKEKKEKELEKEKLEDDELKIGTE